MREYIESFSGIKLDLDNIETYKHLPQNINELNDRMLKNIGYAICYMDYWHLDRFEKEKQPDNFVEWNGRIVNYANSGYNQRQRVYKLIENFTNYRRENWHNLIWFLEQVFLFEDETENMC